jgi:hypothetical protein
LNAVKDIRVGVIGKHAFEIHQVLAKYGDGTADLEDGDEDGGPACGVGVVKKKSF